MTITVESAAGELTTLRITLTPVRFERDGKRAEPPAPQDGRIVVDRSGRVTSVSSVGGATLPLGGSADSLGVLLGAPGRTGRVHVGQRWTTPFGAPGAPAAGSRSTRVAALRYEGDYRCVVLSSTGTRPARHERQTSAGVLRLTGTETGTTETLFAFTEGFPVRIDSASQGRFTVESSQGGTVTIDTRTTITLGKPAATPARSPSPAASPSTKKSPSGSPRGSPTR
jgi:hypothetical protein